jgi:hypothetical protein
LSKTEETFTPASGVSMDKASKMSEESLSRLSKEEQISVLKDVISVLDYSTLMWYTRAQVYKALHGVSFLIGFLLAWYCL